MGIQFERRSQGLAAGKKEAPVGEHRGFNTLGGPVGLPYCGLALPGSPIGDGWSCFGGVGRHFHLADPTLTKLLIARLTRAPSRRGLIDAL